MDYIAAVAGLVGALGIGSAIGQFLAGGQQRRELRSEVYKSYFAVETARWSPDRWSLITAIRELQATALIAGVPRDAVKAYTDAAEVAQANIEDTGDPEIGYFLISDDVAERIEVAAEDFAARLWASWPERLARSFRPKPAQSD